MKLEAEKAMEAKGRKVEKPRTKPDFSSEAQLMFEKIVPFHHTSPILIDKDQENTDLGYERIWDPFWSMSSSYDKVENPMAWSLANPDADPKGLSQEQMLKQNP